MTQDIVTNECGDICTFNLIDDDNVDSSHKYKRLPQSAWLKLLFFTIPGYNFILISSPKLNETDPCTVSGRTFKWP